MSKNVAIFGKFCAGKTTLAAGLALWEFQTAPGRRVHVIANKFDQALLCVDTAREMIRETRAGAVTPSSRTTPVAIFGMPHCEFMTSAMELG